MAMDNCINDHERDGSMDPARAKAARDLFHEQRAALSASSGADEADRLAALAVQKELRIAAAHRHRQMLLQAAAMAEGTDRLARYAEIGDKSRIPWFGHGGALQALMVHDELFPHPTTQSRGALIRARAHGEIADLMQTFHTDLVGRRPKPALLDNVVDEAFGVNTGDASARELAQAWGRASEYLRLKWNQAGGRIGKLENWGLPQFHDRLRVAAVPKQQWMDFVRPRLNRARMLDDATGAPMSDMKLEILLGDAWEGIRSGGLDALTPSGIGGPDGGRGGKLANRRSDPRFLIFNNGPDWRAYQARFGAPDAYVAMMKHIDGMAADIALMQTFGPNPAAGFRQLQQVALKIADRRDVAAGGVAHVNRVRSENAAAQKIYRQLSGEASHPAGAGRLAHALQDVRSVLQAAQLEMAVVSAITGDAAMARMAASFAGARPLRVLQNYAALMNPANKADRVRMIRSRLIAEQFSADGMMAMRYFGDTIRPSAAGRLSDLVLRASGLSAHTQNMRWAFGAELLGALADNAALRMDALEPPLRNTLLRYGVDADRWDLIRATPMEDWKGSPLLSIENLAARTDLSAQAAEDLALRVMTLVHAETEFAVPTVSLRGRAILDAGPPGSLWGEVVKFGSMYKSFPMALTLTHGQRIGTQPGWGKAQYGAQLALSMGLAGAVALALGDMLSGKDPPPMDNAEFALRALMKGGALMVYGDLIFPRADRGTVDYAGAFAGPAAGLLTDVLGRFLGANIGRAWAGKETQFGADFVRLLDRYMPGGDLWYWKAAVDRVFFDSLRRMTDPKAEQKFRQQERRLLKEHGQRSWWRPGEMGPQRAPDPGAVLGD